jgi:membrane protein
VSLPRQGQPQTPTELSGGSWLPAAKRSVKEFQDDALTDRAATLTYYAVLAIFPGLLFLVSLLGLLGKRATQPLINNLAAAVPGQVHETLITAVNHLQQGHATAGLLAILGMAAALWSSSSYTAAFMRASNAIYDVPEGRPVWKTLPIRVGVTLVLMVLLVVSALMVVVTGGLAARVGHVLGIGSTVVTVWDIAKWPVLLILVSLMLALLYWASPNAKHGFRWISPGGLLAVIGWLIASGLFTIYVANFGHYNKIYGSLATVIIFFVWLWISNIAVLFGAEFNAELERGRAMAAGAPADKEPFVELGTPGSCARRPRRSARPDGSGQHARPAPSRHPFLSAVRPLGGSTAAGGSTSAYPGKAAMRLLAGRRALTTPAGKQRLLAPARPGVMSRHRCPHPRSGSCRYQRYQRRRLLPVVSAARNRKPTSQIASTISAIHHSR